MKSERIVRNRAIASAIAAGSTYKEVSAKFDVPMGSIHCICKSLGVSKRIPRKPPEIVDDKTCKINLTQGYWAVVDKEDLLKVTKYLWYAEVRSCGRVYARCDTVDGLGRVYLHQYVMEASGEKDIDHKDRDGLNCRKDNLRECSRACNNANSRPRKSKSGLKGVWFDTECNIWRARIYFQKQCVSLGKFDSPEQAATAYDSAAIRLYGEFARTNQVTPSVRVLAS